VVDPNDLTDSLDDQTLPPDSSAPSAESHRALGMGDRIEPYRVLGILGEGGFGVVYEAEQTEPVRRRVALKIIKPGMDSKEVVARFDAERQALAVMDHPCIAKVFDGGMTDPAHGSRPFFVMELVNGEPITEFCDRVKMSVRERVVLFAKVCGAVQHAHAKGVIHRDLKPSNILVGYTDNDPSPKVIDFGIAKALNQRLTEQTIFTQQGLMIGTPEYMSPEQADQSAIDIDTRTDVYALGAVLYELLTGQPAFDSTSLRSAGFDEMRRVIREVDPPRPSTRLSSAGEVLSAAENRRSRVHGLSTLLRRDLDWVVMKCLEKDRTRRYDTPSELANELERYLADEPVFAGPPSVSYKVSKFVKRHRAGVAAAGVLAVAVSAGLFGTIAGLSRAYDAEQERRLEADRKLNAAEFLTRNLITEISPYETGPDTTVTALLDAATARIDRDLKGDERTEALVRQALGVAFRDLGVVERGREELEAAVEIFDRLEPGGDASEAAMARLDLATALWRLDEADRAAVVSEQALVELDATLGPEDRRVLRARSQLASSIKHAGDPGRAEEIYRACLALAEGRDDVEPEWLTTTRYDLALAVQAQGRVEEARRMFGSVLEAQVDRFGFSSAIAVRTRSELASSLVRLGRHEEAEERFEIVIPQLESVFGEDHPRRIEALANRGVNALRGGNAEDAVRLLEVALATVLRISSWAHQYVPPIERSLAAARIATGRLEEAELGIDEALDGLLAASSLEMSERQERARSLACHAAELFDGIDDERAARFRQRCEASGG